MNEKPINDVRGPQGVPALCDGRDERTDPPANADDAPTATGYPESSPPGAAPAPRECMRPAPPSPSPAGPAAPPPAPSRLRPDTRALETRESLLIEGLTSGSDLTAGLSVLADAREELEALRGLVSTVSDLDPANLVSLIAGIARRLGAAHALLTDECTDVFRRGTP